MSPPTARRKTRARLHASPRSARIPLHRGVGDRARADGRRGGRREARLPPRHGRGGPDLRAKLNLHPHVHALLTRGGWTPPATRRPCPMSPPPPPSSSSGTGSSAAPARQLLDEDRTRPLLSWPRALEALARYGLRNPVRLARLRWRPGGHRHAGPDDSCCVILRFAPDLAATENRPPASDPRLSSRGWSREASGYPG